MNTDGVNGKQIELCTGTDTLSKKTYNFDRVFLQAADQSMVFDDTVRPIIDDVSICLALWEAIYIITSSCTDKADNHSNSDARRI